MTKIIINVEHQEMCILKKNQKSYPISTSDIKKQSIDIVYLHKKIIIISQFYKLIIKRN